MAPEKQLNNDIYVVSSYIIDIYGFDFTFQRDKHSTPSTSMIETFVYKHSQRSLLVLGFHSRLLALLPLSLCSNKLKFKINSIQIKYYSTYLIIFSFLMRPNKKPKQCFIIKSYFICRQKNGLKNEFRICVESLYFTSNLPHPNG